MAAKILNLRRVPRRHVDDPDFRTAMKTLRLGAAAGGRRLYVNIDHVKPGAKSVKYHAHSLQEEFFLILGGRGALRIGGREVAVKEGDFFAKPAGTGLAHQFLNTGRRVLKILDCGLVEPDDVVTYPDEGVVLFQKTRRAFRRGRRLRDWTSDPNAPAS